MISAVLDTNVLASGTISANTPPGQILDAWLDGQFELVTSVPIINELQRTLRKPYFQDYLKLGEVMAFIHLLQNESTVVIIVNSVSGVATHPQDDLILATAVNAKTDYLVTGDGPLLRKVGKIYKGVKLITPSDFLKVLDQQI